MILKILRMVIQIEQILLESLALNIQNYFNDRTLIICLTIGLMVNGVR